MVVAAALQLAACGPLGSPSGSDQLQEACFGEGFQTDANGTQLAFQRSVDDRGRPLEEVHLGGETIVRFTYEYDGNTTTEEWDHDDDGTVELSVRRTYNDHGDLVEEVIEPGGTEDRSYTYDDDGNIVASTISYDGELKYQTTTAYVDGRPTVHFQFDEAGTRIGETTWAYTGPAPSLDGTMTIHPGLLPFAQTYERTYDADDHLLTEVNLHDDEWVAEAELLWSETGVLQERSDISADQALVRRYRPDGLPDSSTVDSDRLGLVETEWVWDCVTEVAPDPQ